MQMSVLDAGDMSFLADQSAFPPSPHPLMPHKHMCRCAYAKGLCAMCGKQILDTKAYKQSAA